MSFLQTIPVVLPWWAAVLVLICGVALGVFGALPWRSTARAAKEELGTIRDSRNRLRNENKDLVAQVAVLQAKTDLNGLRAQFIKSLQEIRDEFKHHSEQDMTTAQQQTAALEAVKISLGVLQEQFKK